MVHNRGTFRSLHNHREKNRRANRGLGVGRGWVGVEGVKILQPSFRKEFKWEGWVFQGLVRGSDSNEKL